MFLVFNCIDYNLLSFLSKMFLSKGVYNKFCEVSRVEALLCLEFPEGPQPPSLFFSGIVQLGLFNMNKSLFVRNSGGITTNTP